MFQAASRLVSPKHPRRNLWPALAAAAASAVLICLLVATSTANPRRFGIVIDAGSTGTRIHVFGYAAAGRGPLALDLEATSVMRVTPGLSSYSADPHHAPGQSLMDLIEFAKEKVPVDQWGDTEVRLMATAGMRMVDAGLREMILESCRRVLRSSGFHFRDDWATVISGADEGIYAWVAANYALGALGGDPQKTTGIIELGGASAQVAFVPSEPIPPEFSHVLRFGETSYNLFSNSFLHFGQNAAYESVHQLLSLGYLKSSTESVHKGMFVDPCTPKGFSHGVKSSEPSAAVNDLIPEYQYVANAVGNFSECRHAAAKLLNKEKGSKKLPFSLLAAPTYVVPDNTDKCVHQQCLSGSPFIPKLNGRFIATENFYYTTKFFGLDPTPVLSDLMLAGEQFCDEDWLNLKTKYNALDDEILSRYCFSSAYIVALLHDSLGIALDDKRIAYANQVRDIQLEWALGAFIMQSSSTLSAEQRDGVAALVRVHSTSLLVLLVFSVLLIFSVWSVSRWRKPQMKTIYDLEKGRYIVTRINL